MKKFLSLSCIKRHEPAAKAKGVSKVARSPRGFLTAYKKAKGDPKKLSKKWRDKREAFIKRHMAQAKNESLYKNGEPTRRHLALVMWAYSPRGCPR